MLIRQGQNTREAALRRYFAKPPEKPSTDGALISLVLGGLALVVGFVLIAGDSGSGLGLFVGFIGLVLAGLGGAQFSSLRQEYQTKLSNLQPQPPDQQVQAWLNEGTQGIVSHSRLGLGLNKSEGDFSNPLIIQTPILSPEAGVDSRDLLWKRGEDGIFRFGVYHIVVIRTTDRHLASYSCYYDFIRDIPVNESTQEFHFCDVVSLSTKETSDAEGHDSKVLPTGQKASARQEFFISVTNGEGLKVTLLDGRVREIMTEERLPESGAEEAVASIRAMLREAKRKEERAGLSSAA